ncbi:preprotein translocase subunit SecY [Buchnera aphidicola]|uniref:Protein translocase subunit SecY n=1 Tax=Buchnera aphidicola (Sarucallis kahawaluokalani) TaxID=1241878 RepID=A0A4D6YM76_9GAMM|nr:preprotein translocase subunit SecY [Buchnera aphidicola]QCI26115.1 preprotein translocase subunit SecY [Buchnera aphidicola (Sarucallis kahawaluokalani)]
MINYIKKKLNNVSNTVLELKKRIIFVIFAIIIFRIGFFIPIPGINCTVLSHFLKQQNGTVVDLFNMFSGGALSHASVFSLGIMPYISASIIMQILTLTINFFANIKKEGEIGAKKITRYTRYIALLVAIVQSLGVSLTLTHIITLEKAILHLDWLFYLTTILSLTTGTVLLMWLSELITECGIGNGTSIIIFIGIISKLPSIIIGIIYHIFSHKFSIFPILLIFCVIFLMLFFISYIESSYRKIILYHSKQRNLHKIYVMQHTHLPLKINTSGVIPIIFTSSTMIILSTICSWLKIHCFYYTVSIIEYYMKPGQLLYIIIYTMLIFYFCFLYSNLICNPRDIAENLKKSGVFIPGIRPGIQTSQYISKIMIRLIFINSLYIICIVLIPELLKKTINIPFVFFNGTSLLIISVVIIDLISQFQTFMISNKYNTFLKKTTLGKNIL